MEAIKGLENFPSLSQNTIITIGNFDGVHLGHQKILKFLVDEAKKNDLFSLVLTFSPHPEKILGKSKIQMIQTVDQRLETIENFGVSGVLVTPFDENFSNLSSRDFIQKILIDTLQARGVVIGENFHFGKNREGDITTLQTLGSKMGLLVHEIPSVTRNGRTVSSSLIRSLLYEGKIEAANSLLGRCYEVEGKVIKGEARGKALGFPTANIETQNEIIPLGVFISEVSLNSQKYSSVTNAGYRPTFGQEEIQIESYIINFNKNLYGKRIILRFIKKIRNEIRFKTTEELSLQIKKDLKEALNYFKLKKNSSHSTA
ncbi:MAG: bifunctional riboflavin kinase/FAD synthetase [Candidatus Aminicenantaceae bacterium]